MTQMTKTGPALAALLMLAPAALWAQDAPPPVQTLRARLFRRHH